MIYYPNFHNLYIHIINDIQIYNLYVMFNIPIKYLYTHMAYVFIYLYTYNIQLYNTQITHVYCFITLILIIKHSRIYSSHFNITLLQYELYIMYLIRLATYCVSVTSLIFILVFKLINYFREI